MLPRAEAFGGLDYLMVLVKTQQLNASLHPVDVLYLFW
jgi:hypothetical protein